ncbi:M1 family metallopeptidase [Aquiflexum sp. TKW24L]|uniref:M1 family metallopeptidase n=1 Tax=Aquiflexum sp. TKW24L TaxID=2942212 RepID=UPI0020C0DD0D|nr:M1 family metallopeptidase [Aquiflexum sp. TKW24L]MCL6258021.1 M1 family metallopeptidase [Aquiflexum sp. TKW24L]
MDFNKPKALLAISIFLIWSCQSSKPVSDQVAEVPSSQLEIETNRSDSNDASQLKELIPALENRIASYKASDTRYFDLLHTALDLSFDYQKEWVNGVAVLTFKPYFYPQRELVLDAQDFDIHGFLLLEKGKESELNFRYNGQTVTAYLPQTYTSKDTITVRIKYTAKPNENPELGSAAITDTKGLYFINARGEDPNKPTMIWTQGESEHNSKWFPTIDSPNERMTQEIKMTVDKKLKTISNGLLKSSKVNADGTRTDHWVMDLPHAPYLAAVIVGDFVEIKDNWEGMPVSYYVEKEFEEGAKTVFQNTPEMIGFFSKILCVRYPWQKYDQVVVRDFVSGAMENTTISVFMEDLNLDARAAIDSEWDGIIAHELFHQWLGDYVTNESWANLTLNEAFANYSEYLWFEYKDGKDDADMHHISEMEMYFDESKEKQVDLIRFYHNDSEDMFDSHSYAKGGRILHMLRRHIGDEAFFAGVKLYLNKHAFSSVEVHDLRLAFEEVTGQDLNWYFNQWFLSSGHPTLEYEIDYSQPGNLLLTVSQKQDLTSTPLYKIPFKVSWYHEGKRHEKELVLDKAWQQFAIENKVPLKELYFDEAMELLAEKKSSRGVDHFKKQFSISSLGVSRFEALDSLANIFADDPEVASLVGRALNDPFYAIREAAIMHIAQHPDWLLEISDLEDRLLEMAETDPKNTVKQGAIEMLSLLDPDKYAPKFMEWMEHPSYYVAGAALAAYLENENNADRVEIANRFESEKNIRLVVPVAEYYITNLISGKAEWFHNNLELQGGQSLYYFLGYYSEYFVQNPGEGKEKAINNLYTIAKENNSNYVRIGAFMGLFGFIDEPGVLDKAKELYSLEKDDLAKRYEEFFLSQYLEEN